MTGAIVFETPGLLDLKAATTFGINVKTRENPIGYFGTGLKYAIAVLVREGIDVTIHIGPKEYVFYKKASDFRGKEFDFVMMKQRNGLLGRWTAKQMPFTTEFGKNWELWQAFRELESNTRDEGGHTIYMPFDVSDIQHRPDTTRIVVSGEKFVKVWEERDKIFLPEALTLYDGTKSIQVFKQPSQAVYYRGLKVMELPTPSKLTYNILSQITLTEDRTVKYEFDVRSKIMKYLACDCTDQQEMNEIISADPEKWWEGKFDWEYLYDAPSQLFMNIIAKKKARAAAATTTRTAIPARLDRMYERWTPTPPRKKEPVNKCISNLARWIDNGLIRDEQVTADIQEAIRILRTHDDYNELEVIMVPKNQTKAGDYIDGDDIPF